MNISRLAALAVIFMMVLSAFVAIPAYNASADHENHDDEEHDHDHDDDNGDHDNHGLPSFSDLDENGNGTIEFNELMAICPEDQSEEQCRGIFDQYSGEDGVIDENEYQRFVSDVTSPDDGPDTMMVCYDIDTHEVDFSITTPEACNEAGLMWVSANSGPNDGDDRGDDNWDLENFRVHIKMESLGDWLVTIEGDYPVAESNDFREDLAEMCEDMTYGNPGEITEDCYEHFLMMGDDDDHDDHDGHGDHNGHEGWSCPPGLTDDECDMMEDCQDNNMAGMSCQRMMYDFCNDNPGACDFDDDDNNFFFAMFAYEDGNISAEEFLSNNAIQSMFNDDDDDGTDGGPSNDWGQGKYDFYTFTSEMDGIAKIYSEFVTEHYESPNFICGNGDEVPFYWVNDGYADCEDGADEQWYDSNTPNDTSDDCQKWDDDDCVGDEVNWFDCHDGSTVWITQVNNGEDDCDDGEDEDHSGSDYWYGSIYLLSGEFTGDSLGTELTPDHEAFMSGEIYNCYWGDDNKTFTDCSNFIPANLVAGNTYTLVTVGECHSYNDEEMDCQTGNYMHTMHTQDGTSMNMSGNVTDDHPMADFSEVMRLHDDSILGNFVLYDERAFNVGENGFEGTFVSYSTACHDYDRDGEYDYCYGSSPSIYLYENFDSSDTESGLVGSASADYNNDPECPDSMEDCNRAIMDVELTPGNYTLVTAFDGQHDVLFMNMVQTSDGTTVSEWDGKVRNAYFSYNDDDNGTETLVEGNDRIHMPYPEYDYICYDDNDNEIDCDDMFDGMVLAFAFMENMTAYEDGDMNATTAAENVLDILYAMADEGFFDHHDDHDDHDDHVYWSQWNYCEWEGDSSLQDGDMRWYCTDNDDGTNGFDDWWYYCEAHNDGMDGTTYFCTDDFGQSPDYENSASNDHYVTGGSPDGGYHGDHDDHYDGSSMTLGYFDVSSWDSTNDLQEIVDWFNDEYYYEENEEEWSVDDFLGMCDADPEYVDNDVAQCVLDEAMSMLDDDDNPALLDGIIGIQDPQDAGDDCRPSADDPHLLGNVDDNADQPLTCTFEFNITFDGVDDSLDTHEAYIPFEDEQLWTLKIEMLEGYEFISCDNCDVDDEGVMTGSGPVNITFAKSEPQPDCDVVVGLSADGMAFDPVKLTIKVGETVCWQWEDAAMAHNVVELEGEYDSTSNLTAIDFGFSSGEPAMTVDFRHTFTEDNKVHYYVCAPHAQLGMVGQVTVGNGTDDPVQQAIEDEEVPSLGFVFGSLVLVGAAGLRRRIH